MGELQIFVSLLIPSSVTSWQLCYETDLRLRKKLDTFLISSTMHYISGYPIILSVGQLIPEIAHTQAKFEVGSTIMTDIEDNFCSFSKELLFFKETNMKTFFLKTHYLVVNSAF